MKIIYVHDNKAHWITPYITLKDVPEHPPGDIYVVAKDEVTEGWDYHADGTFTPPINKQYVNDITLLDLAKQISELEANLVIAGVIEISEQDWTDRHNKNMVSDDTFNRLVASDKLERAENSEYLNENVDIKIGKEK